MPRRSVCWGCRFAPLHSHGMHNSTAIWLDTPEHAITYARSTDVLQISITEVRARFIKVPGDQKNGVVGKGAYSYVTRLFDRERMALATSKTFREKVSPAQRREEVDALLQAGRHPNLVRALAYLERAGVVECFF